MPLLPWNVRTDPSPHHIINKFTNNSCTNARTNARSNACTNDFCANNACTTNAGPYNMDSNSIPDRDADCSVKPADARSSNPSTNSCNN